jgi:hypothetical protein
MNNNITISDIEEGLAVYINKHNKRFSYVGTAIVTGYSLECDGVELLLPFCVRINSVISDAFVCNRCVWVNINDIDIVRVIKK